MKTLTDSYQSRLFPYAYNILGSVDDALDAIQDVMVNYPDIADRNLDNEMGYLVKSVINKSITLKSKKKKTAHNVWLPEPVATEYADTNLKREEIISYSILALLEYLNPKERAVFILKEAFDYSHEDIAGVLSTSVENSRKLLSRARAELKANKPEIKTHISPPKDVLMDYVQIIKNGNIKELEKKLSEEARMLADGGGKISVVREITTGREAVAELILYLYKKYQKHFSFRLQSINHQPAILFYQNDSLINCQVFEIGKDSDIRAVYSIVDPDKLKNLPFS